MKDAIFGNNGVVKQQKTHLFSMSVSRLLGRWWFLLVHKQPNLTGTIWTEVDVCVTCCALESRMPINDME